MGDLSGFSASFGRWMGLDVGSKAIGVAVSDPLKLTAYPLTTIRRRDLRSDAEALLRLIREQEVELLVLGKPLRRSGEEGPVWKLALSLLKELGRRIELPVRWVDESLSSKEAEEILRELQVPPHRRRERRDEIAAALILRRALEEGSRSGV